MKNVKCGIGYFIGIKISSFMDEILSKKFDDVDIYDYNYDIDFMPYVLNNSTLISLFKLQDIFSNKDNSIKDNLR